MCQFLKDGIILHRISMFFAALKAQISVSPEKTHIISVTTKTNAWEWNKPKKGEFRDNIEWYAKVSLNLATLIV